MHRAFPNAAILPAVFLAACHASAVTPAPAIEGLPVVRVRHADGSDATDLRPVGAPVSTSEKDGTVVTETFKDAKHALTVRVCKKTFTAYPAVEQWVEVVNNESGPVVLDRVESSAPTLRSPNGVWLKHFTGSWANELNPVEAKVEKAVSLATKRGTRVSEDTPPFFFLSVGGPIQENKGEVLAGTLVWNGNFAYDIAPTEGGVVAHCGLNPAGSRYTLDAGKTFVAPRMLWMRGQNGAGELARTMHKYIREKVLRDGTKTRPVLLNNWEATGFNFDEKKLVGLFDGAKETGFDLFLLDDGWFATKYPRNNDKAGLGDWEVNPKKLPHGVSFLCDEAKKRGLQFGIWVEPEMVNPKSALYEKHPDWVIGYKDKPLDLKRSQAVLDLTRPEVREFAFKVTDDLLTSNPGVSYVKWDCNRHITQPGSTWLAVDRQENLFVDYANALDDIMARTAAKHPSVEMMLCAGGGGRVDLRSLRHFHEFWPSDNTDPVRRVKMQWEYAAMYPAISVCAHVTHWGKRPLKFAFDVAMSGRLGADIDLGKLPPDERKFTARAVATYKKEVGPLVQFGEQYRLESPYAGPRAAMNFVSADKSSAVLFVYQLKDGEPAPVRPQSLDPKATYRVREVNLEEGKTSSLAADGKEITGETLMRDGIAPTCRKAVESTVVMLVKVK